MTISATSYPVLRQISVRAAVDMLLQEGPTSRATLAKKTGLSKQTMSEVIRILEEDGWVQIKGVETGRVGRSAVTYEFNGERGFAAGIEIGSGLIRVALVDVTGRVRVEREQAVNGDGAALVAKAGAMVTGLLGEEGIPGDRLLLATVAMPGAVEPSTGRLRLAPDMDPSESLDVAGSLQAVLGCEVSVENDINAAMLGEAWRGCAAGVETSAFLSLGEGVGLGLMAGGVLIRGARGAAGELAYLPFGGNPDAPEGLERGALECVLGSRGIIERYDRLTGGASGFQAADILQRAHQADEAAAEVLRETARLAALALVSIDAMFDPEQIVLGGTSGLVLGLLEEVQAILPSFTRRAIRLERSQLELRAPLVGAVAIALNLMHNRLFSPQDIPSQLRLPPVQAT
ncbi:ROK family transcriptional regulator [Roseibium suaedae]|uniref:Sugar kinase of the NBD/HSP70 family, may contain an N-terminal HTH domain n=1 Tax=Roseibium suaedae TaxID=735517 RepID=A0A1M7A746_9HYPH|nr:ROK family transcriptional regulator [Roseibium suaedae]SHL38491.1 Sugar kinase of the NBD/HSP70 family, may contain an N-terminal HTH domain [Roseibium suaedae]